ncbi:hypothetical protein DINM_006902 [Dirofilaria immitis]|nr:hypothetical protein [Dirofilaria immitis]
MNIDMSQMKPIGTKQIIAFVNYFMVRNVQMLQSFVSNMERRIIDMEKRLNRVEVELKLLEHKLNSVPGLQTVVPKGNELLTGQHYDGLLVKGTLKDETVDNTKVVDSESLSASSSVAGVERPQESMASNSLSAEQNHSLHIRDDPRYAVYFKMLKMGVPECAVKQKMKSEGIDTALLQTPDAFSDLPKNAIASIDRKEPTSADDDQSSTSSSDR